MPAWYGARRLAALRQGGSALSRFLAAQGWTGSTDGADFEAGIYWVAGTQVTAADFFARYTCATTTARCYADATGLLKNDLAANQPRFTYADGRYLLLIERAATNRCTAAKVNPSATTNITKGGDAASVLSVASQSSVIAASIYATIASSGNAYKLDNSAGSTAATATIGGTAPDASKHSIQAVVWGGTGNISLSGASAKTFSASATPQKITIENLTPAAGNQLVITADAGQVVYFICPGLYSREWAPLYPIIGAATASVDLAVEQLRPSAALEASVLDGEFLLCVEGRYTGRNSTGNIVGRQSPGIFLIGGAGGVAQGQSPNTVAQRWLGEKSTMQTAGFRAAVGVSSGARFVGYNSGALTVDAGTPTVSELYFGGTGSSGNILYSKIVAFPTYDTSKAAAFAVYKPHVAVIDCYGDSMTDGVNGNYPLELSKLYEPAAQFNNAGVGGYRSDQIAAKYLATKDHLSLYTVIMAGINDFSQLGYSSGTANIIKENIASMVAGVTTGRYIIMSVMAGTSEVAGGSPRTIIDALNADFAALYGSHYLDVLTPIVALGAPGQPYADATNYANSVPPSGLMYDARHLNATGNVVLAGLVKAKADALGYPGA